MNSGSFLLILVIFFTACKGPHQAGTAQHSGGRILFFTDQARIPLEEQLKQAAGKAGWKLTKASSKEFFSEDSLRHHSGMVIPFSAMNVLDHRALTNIKRFTEAGGGIIAIKDTVFNQPGWPWLSAWNDLATGQNLKQDAARIQILVPAFTAPELQKAITYAVGNNTLPDYSRAITVAAPEANRFTYQILSQGMDEPMQMAILPDYNVLIVERKGGVKLYDAKTKNTQTIAHIEVFSGIEDGLLGVALDPDYTQNHWVYFYYAVPGEKAINRLSRMEFKDRNLLRPTEKTLLEIPTQRKYCCHSAGYLNFGPDGLLYLSTGDNTNAEETEGYIPIDERPGRELADDQATAASSNDLRGKILRIKPEPDGSYSIPDGNLFPKGMPKTRPEIYTMGHRNPYRFTVDMKNGFLYWGDVGPDTKVPASEGTLSFDEINQARKPGFFGWPYFLGNNEAFPYYNFATKQEGPKFNPLKPINNSPNNTGIRELPPAQPAMIWYGDGASKTFPLVGKGGESAMAGPVYYADLFPDAKFKLPRYYDGKLFIYDWVRRWFAAVTFDKNLNYARMEPFLEHISFIAPTDMKFAPDGSIYILEYGTNWFAKNTDAKLIRIEYAEGNRKPVATIKASNHYGAAPFNVHLSAADSKDFDKDDKLKYTWLIEGKNVSGESITHTFEKPGVYPVTLTVTDNHGEAGTATIEIKAGNAPPVVTIATTANRSFYWDNVKLDYKIEVTDTEDQVIDPKNVQVSFNFLPQGKDIAVALTNPQPPKNLLFVKGQYLLNNLDCKACHSLDQKSIGPNYLAVAKRYAGKTGMVDKLAKKVIEGGSGNWGQRPMSAHPDLAVEDAREIVQYILSLGEEDKSLPLRGALTLKDHIGKGKEGSYLLLASYTDKGANNIEPLAMRSHLALRHPLVQIEDYDDGAITLRTVTTEFLTYAAVRHGNYVKYNQLDLSQLAGIRYRVQPQGVGGTIEMRIDRMDGPLISTINVPAGGGSGSKQEWLEMATPLSQIKGSHDVFLVFTNKKEPQRPLFNIDWLFFSNKK